IAPLALQRLDACRRRSLSARGAGAGKRVRAARAFQPKRSLPCAADRGDVPALSRREALRDRGTQALDVDEAAPLRIEHVAQGLAAVLARAGRVERDVHPAGIGPLRRVVALADQLVELEVALDPARELERGHPGDLDVGGLAGAVLARALPARGLLLQRP